MVFTILVYFIIVLTVLLVISYIFQLNVVITLVVLLLILLMYLIFNKILQRRYREELIENNLIIARQYLLSGEKIMLVIHQNNKVIWANDSTYNHFRILLDDRNLESIDLVYDGVFEYKNKYYKSEKLSDNAIILLDVTDEERENRILKNNQPNIGIFQLDNYDYLESVMTNTEFINMISKVDTLLINYFDTNQVFYEEITEHKYILVFKSDILNRQINDRFKELDKLFQQFNTDEYELTFSIGIGLNQGSGKSNGLAAKAAFNLALTRGGGQIVVYDKNERSYIGGHSKGIKGTLRLKARILANTISNTIFSSDVVYLFTHQNPDSDAIASVILMSKLIKSFNNKITTRIMLDSNIDSDLQNYIDDLNYNNVLYDAVVDKTKINSAIICDTQSIDYVANQNVLENIEDKIIIDHHQTPVKFIEDALFSWVETNASSTTEMVVEMLITRNVKLDDTKVSNLGLLGIMTDSSNLQFRTDANTLDVMSYLVSNGASIEQAYRAQYLSADLYKLKQQILSTIEFKSDVAILHFDGLKDDFIMANCVNEAMKIKNINVALIHSEVDDKIKVKIRSNQYINVKNIIENYGGGGHQNQAAGYIKKSDLDNLINDLINRNKE